MARMKLSERNQAAIGYDAAPIAPSLNVDAAKEAPSRAPHKPAIKKASQTKASDVERFGLYLAQSTFDDARAAYLADWGNGGDADTYARWVADAMDTHASRTAAARMADSRLTARAAERTGTTRSFNIRTSSMQRMREAIAKDQKAGRWPSESGWAVEAIEIAIDTARERNGGTLPTPPSRLPNRLRR